MSFTYDAFLSYSHADKPFASSLEKKLERYLPPRGLSGNRRRLRVFRDESDIDGNELDAALKTTLESSEFLIVVCSEAARGSAFVGQEVTEFCSSRGPENLLLALVSGRPNHEVTADGSQDAAFPDEVYRLLEQPLAADFRKGRGFLEDRRRSREALFHLIASIRRQSKEELLRRYERFVRARRWTVAVVLLATVGVFSLLTWRLQTKAVQQTVSQLASRSLSESSNESRALLLAYEAVRRSREGLGRIEPVVEHALRQASANSGGHVLLGDDENAYPLGLEIKGWARSRNGRFLVAGWLYGPSRLATVWDLASDSPASSARILHTGALDEIGIYSTTINLDFVAVSDDGKVISGCAISGSRFPIWTAQPDSAVVRTVLPSGERSCYGQAVSPDGRWVVEGDHLWDLSVAPPAGPWNVGLGHHYYPNAYFESTSDGLFTFSSDRLQYWTLGSLEPANETLFESSGDLAVDELDEIALDKSGRSLVGWASDGRKQSVVLWDLGASAGGERFDLSGPEGEFSDDKTSVVVFDAKAERLFVGGMLDQPFMIELDKSGARATRIPVMVPGILGPDDEVIPGVLDAAFSADGRWFATVGAQLDLWDLAKDEPTTSPPSLSFPKPGREFHQVAFSPNGRWLVTTELGRDLNGYAARVWALEGGDPSGSTFLIPLVSSESDETSVFFSPDGSRLGIWQEEIISNASLTLFSLEVEDLVKEAGQLAGRNLRPKEWEFNFPGENYRRTFDSLPSGKVQLDDLREKAQRGEVESTLAELEDFTIDHPSLDPKSLVARWIGPSLVSQMARSVNDGELEEAEILLEQLEDLGYETHLTPATIFGLFRARPLIRSAVEAGDEDGDVEKAQALLEEAKRFYPALDMDPVEESRRFTARNRLSRGREAAVEGDLQLAEALFSEARQLDPSVDLGPDESPSLVRSRSLISRARTIGRSGDFYGAKALYEEAKALDPSLDLDPAAEARRRAQNKTTNRGMRLVRMGEEQKVVDLYRESLGLDEAGAKLVAAPQYVSEGDRLAREMEWQEAVDLYRIAASFDPDGDLDPVARANERCAQAHRNKGSTALRTSAKKANDQFTRAHELFPGFISVHEWNSLCWKGSVAGIASLVLHACEKAVERAAENEHIRSSRGLARALTGDFRGAIEDFEFFLASNASEKDKAKRQSWLEALKRGESPFDDATLLSFD